MILVQLGMYEKYYQDYTVREAVKLFREEFDLVGRRLKGKLEVYREVGKDGFGFTVWRKVYE